MTTRPEPGRDRPDPGLSAIMGERRQLINLTYRLLGSLAEAEDAVQETYTRWYALSRQQQEAIESPGAWLTTVASRICLNLLGSARARRETYVGEWIPEPLPERTEWISGRPDGTSVDPADRVTLDESVNMAFLVVLESMTPAERVAFIQRQARPGGPARRRHRDGVRVRRRGRPDHAHLGRTQPRETPSLDDGLTRVPHWRGETL
jgi:DNA-directed RNA polymerase specialized sigma24 family protein